jgi:hypothetical protein
MRTSCDAGALVAVGSTAARRDAVLLAERGLPTGTVTFFFSDVEGSTRLLDELGAERYADALAAHRRVFREAFEANGGVEVDTRETRSSPPSRKPRPRWRPPAGRRPSSRPGRSTFASEFTPAPGSLRTAGTSGPTSTERRVSRGGRARRADGRVVVDGGARA